MTLDDVVERYNRQMLITGWDQEKLSRASVALIGNGPISNFTAIALSALGFGKIEIYGSGTVTDEIVKNHKRTGKPDYSHGFVHKNGEGKSKVESLAEFAGKINSLVKIQGIPINFANKTNVRILGQPQLIIETSNDPTAKMNVFTYAKNEGIPVISASATDYIGGLGLFTPRTEENLMYNLLFLENENRPQGITTSQVMGILAAEEARKAIMPLKNEKQIDDVIIYNLASQKRFDRQQSLRIDYDNLVGKHCVLIGAGALSNHTALNLALNGVKKLTIIDFDKVESTNINRQFMFYDSIGEYKAIALADKIKQINPRVSVSYELEKITPASEKEFAKMKPDMIIDGVDNNKTRALLNYFSLKYNIPFVSGGTKFDSGQVVTCVPNITSCLNCQSDIDNLAIRMHRPASCIYAPDPSVITSNGIIGAMIGGEAAHVANDQAIHGVLKFISADTYRLGILPSVEGCTCSAKEKVGTWMEKMAYLYE